MRYAEFDTGESLDLWRFNTKQERDQFLLEHPSNASKILYKDAKYFHKEQFAFWMANK